MPRRLLCWSLFLIVSSGAGAQTGATAAPADSTRDQLLNSFQIENRRGTYIFYTQTYSLHRRPVKFHGSIFGLIQDVQADGCELKIRSEIFDRYSGSIGSKLVGQTQNKYITSVDFILTKMIAEDLKIVEARPVRQLGRGTNAVCSETQDCNLTWLKLTTDTPVIRMTDITDDVADYDGDIKDFDGLVKQAYLPLSSTEAGNELIAKLQAFAQTCAR